MVKSIAISPDGQNIAGTVFRMQGSNGSYYPGAERIQLWSVQDGKELWRANLSFRLSDKGHLAFSPDGRLLAGAIDDQIVQLLDASTGKLRHEITGVKKTFDGGLAFSRDSERLVTGGSSGVVKLFDTRTGQQVHAFQANAPVTKIVFNAQGTSLAVANAGGSIQVLSTEPPPGRTHLEGVSHVAAFSPDGRLVAATDPGNAVLLYDAFTGKRRHRLEGTGQGVAWLSFSDDSKRLVVGGGDKLWVGNVETGRPFDDSTSCPDGCGWRPCRRTVADWVARSRGYGDGPENSLRVWDVATGKLLHSRPYHGETLTLLVAFQDGDRTVALRQQNGKLQAWSIQSGESVKPRHEAFAWAERKTRTADGRALLREGRGIHHQGAP